MYIVLFYKFCKTENVEDKPNNEGAEKQVVEYEGLASDEDIEGMDGNDDDWLAVCTKDGKKVWGAKIAWKSIVYIWFITQSSSSCLVVWISSVSLYDPS